MTDTLPVLGEKHIDLLNRLFHGSPLLRDIEAHVRAIVAGEVVEVSRNVAIHLREAHADWLTPQTQEKPE